MPCILAAADSNTVLTWVFICFSLLMVVSRTTLTLRGHGHACPLSSREPAVAVPNHIGWPKSNRACLKLLRRRHLFATQGQERTSPPAAARRSVGPGTCIKEGRCR